ncbi:hypothetical protein ILUMI_14559 [Ignelater luminosus]|uniref:CCHC-type domain-containing protein n=1 Tax=Ignelater luminosus TaxID=2038154 RepID=A0A8K0G9X1_IGNLU|nr:hypothetical protein ILUMI_14559 [Ignelater luminosus]
MQSCKAKQECKALQHLPSYSKQCKTSRDPIEINREFENTKVRPALVSMQQPGTNNTLQCYNFNGANRRASECPKPRRQRGSCYECRDSRHQQKVCPKLRRPRPAPQPDSTNALFSNM